jgi:hemin uptake protein HemP
MPREQQHQPQNHCQTPQTKLAPDLQDCPEVQFLALSNGHSELIIEHLGQKYRLIATRHGKLVLNK